MSDVAIVQFATFLTLVAGFVWQWLREKRNRAWEIEDRRELAEKVVQQADTVAASVQMQSDKLHEAIKENTEVSTKAFHEANSVNLKIESLGLEHNALQRKEQAKDKKKP